MFNDQPRLISENDGTVLSAKIRLGQGPHGAGIFALADIDRDEDLLQLSGVSLSQPTRYTIQVAAHEHIDAGSHLWAVINHACAPNCVVDLQRRVIRSICPIAQGTELTFNYLTTEWEMATPFNCHCGASHCPGLIAGLKHLTLAQVIPIQTLIAPYLLDKYFIPQ
jgi:SET domain